MSIKLSSGYDMPLFGLGTWLSNPGEVKSAVKCAIENGYRHIDCAWIYKNETEVGEALKEVINEGKVKREDLFITSKLWNSFHRPEEVPKGVTETMDALQVKYLDLYLIHWPVAFKPGVIFPSNETVLADIDEVDLVQTYKAMESLVDSGLIKSIGISNFTVKQIQYILDHCRIKPAMLQIELHVYFPNKELVELCKKNDIHVTAYSPLGAPNRPGATPGEVGPLTDPRVLEIAKKMNVTPSQVLISYVIHKGIVCIPKSVSPLRIKENVQALNVKLSEKDFEVLDNFNINRRYVIPSIMAAHKEYPFEER